MATLAFVCGCECGVVQSLGLIGSHWHTATFNTSIVRSGSRSVRINAIAGNNAAQIYSLSGQDRLIWRFYIRFETALPLADCNLFGTIQDGGTGPCVRFKVSDSKIYAAVGTTLGASGVAVSTGSWIRIDVDWNIINAANDFCDVQVDGVACGQATAAGINAGPQVLYLGQSTGIHTYDIYYEDFALSVTAADYPLGGGYVIPYIPNADGAHNVAGANDFELPDGTDITNATTTAWQQIDKKPLPSVEGEYIEGTAPPNATDYVEWQYENSVESNAPRTVEAILALSDAGGAGTCAFSVTLREHAGSTTADIFNSTQNVGATMTYSRAHFATVPGTSDPWTLTKFNALRSRFLVSDASPDPRVNAAMLEAEYAAVVAGPDNTLIGVPYGQSGQRQMRQLLAT